MLLFSIKAILTSYKRFLQQPLLAKGWFD